ncbi:MAG TPA: hypothetical protein VFC02_16065 [Anaerolineales bacterium]|jgi:hypothetical protein|nr:hypothetical protein [Anaerolineales bacterium]
MERQRPSRANVPSSQETSEMRYARLRTDVQKWIDGEQEKKRAWIEGGRKEEEEGYDPHTDRINYEHLTEIDLDFWEKLQGLKRGQPFPMDDWERYDVAFKASIDRRQVSSTSSRIEFRAAMGNQVAVRNIIAEIFPHS